MANCVYVPTVTNKNGEEVNSKLFSDLMENLGKDRETVNRLYESSLTPTYLNSIKRVDSLGEPYAEDVIRDFLPDNIDYLERMSFKKLFPKDKKESLTDLAKKIIEYNSSGKYAAKVNLDGNVEMVLRDTNLSYTQLLKEGLSVNEAIIRLLNNWGFAVDVNSNYSREHGLFNPFKGTKKTEDGLTIAIQIANNKLGEKSLPEEMAHFIVEASQQTDLGLRLMNLLKKEGIVEAILGEEFTDYKNYYKNSEELLRKEAAGQLLYSYLQGETVKIPQSVNLLQRVWNWFKNKLIGRKESELNSTIKKAREQAKDLAQVALEGGMTDILSSLKLDTADTLADLSEESDKIKTTLESILERIEINYAKEMERLSYISAPTIEQNRARGRLKDILAKKNKVAALKHYISYYNEKMEQFLLTFENLDAEGNSHYDLTTNEGIVNVAKRIRSIEDFMNNNRGIIEYLIDFKNNTEDEDVFISKEDKEIIEKSASDISVISIKVMNEVIRRRNVVLNVFFRPYINQMASSVEQKLLLDKMWQEQERDINFFNRWFDSATQSGSLLLGMISNIIAERKYNGSQRHELFASKINDLVEDYAKKTGSRDFKFVHSFNEYGLPTGYYRGYGIKSVEGVDLDIDYEGYNEAKRTAFKIIENSPIDISTKIEAKRSWESSNNTSVKIRIEDKSYQLGFKIKKVKIPKPSLYKIDFSPLNSNQAAFLKEFLNLKWQMDDLLPESKSTPFRAIGIRSRTGEIVESRDKKIRTIGKRVKESFKRNVDDIEYGIFTEDSNKKSKVVKTTPTGQIRKEVPIYYDRLINSEDLSLDAPGSLTNYASMAIQYDEITSIIDLMELSKERAVGTTAIGIDEGIRIKLGGNIVERVANSLIRREKSVTKRFKDSFTYELMEDYFNRVLYGIKKNDTKTDKIIDNIIHYTSMKVMAFNPFVGINNILMGQTQQLLEAFAVEDISLKDLLKADTIYFRRVADTLMEHSSNKPKDFLTLLRNKFDVSQNYLEEQQRINFYKTKAGRRLSKTSLWFMSTMGEHYLTSRTLLALLNKKYVLVNNKKVTLLEALSKTYKETGKLELSKEVTDLNNNPIDSNYIFKIKQNAAGLNHAMNGIYDSDSKAAINKFAIGRAVLMFRNWMVPHYNRRFKREYFDTERGQNIEGFYRTLFLRFTKELIKNKFNIVMSWNDLTSHQQGNVRRALGEMSFTAIIYVISNFLLGDYDDMDSWAGKMLLYQLKRLYLEESTSWIPTKIFLDGKKILQSPTAAISTFEDIVNLLTVSDMYKYDRNGNNMWVRNFKRTIPIYGQIDKAIKMDEGLFTIFDQKNR